MPLHESNGHSRGPVEVNSASLSEIERYILKARKFLSSGDKNRAESIAKQALSIDPNSKQLKDFLREIRGERRQSSDDDDHSSDGSQDQAVPESRNASGNASSATSNGQESRPSSSSYSYSYVRESKSNATSHTDSARTGHSSSSNATSNGSASTGAAHSSPQYTQDQLQEVQRIRRCKDFYEVLQVEKNSTDEEIKKAYRKLALRLHPDKNKAPGATEAFRAVSNAFYILSDAGRRRDYDAHGSRSGNLDHGTFRDGAGHDMGTHRRHGHFHEDEDESYDYARGFESDISAEDIFNMFFGGGFPSQAVFRAHRGPRVHVRSPNVGPSGTNPLVWMQLAPILMLLGVSFLTFLLRSDPVYQLQRSNSFNEEHKTATGLQVSYYVKPGQPGQRSYLEEHYPHGSDSRRQLEDEIESEYTSAVANQCFREENQRAQMIYRARWLGDSRALSYAENLQMPNCDEYKRIRNVLRGY